MFSIDDSFDVDDAFLQVALDIGGAVKLNEDNGEAQPKRRSFEIGLPSQPCDLPSQSCQALNVGIDGNIAIDVHDSSEHRSTTHQVSTSKVIFSDSSGETNRCQLSESILSRSHFESIAGRENVASLDGAGTSPGLASYGLKTGDTPKPFHFKPITKCVSVADQRQGVSSPGTAKTSCVTARASHSSIPVSWTSSTLLPSSSSLSQSNLNQHYNHKVNVSGFEQEASLPAAISSAGGATTQSTASRRESTDICPGITVGGDDVLFGITEDSWDGDIDDNQEQIATCGLEARRILPRMEYQEKVSFPGTRAALRNVDKQCTHPCLDNDEPLQKLPDSFHSPVQSEVKPHTMRSSVQHISTRSHSEKPTISRLSTGSLNEQTTPLQEIRQQHVVEITTPVRLSKHTPDVETPLSSRSASSMSLKRKRKFPGPAGVLPKLRGNTSLAELDKYKPAESPRVPVRRPSDVVSESQVPCSQGYEDRFLDGPWQVMKRDLEPQAELLLQEYSLQAIIKKASKKLLPRGKVPIMCVLIDQISTQNEEASAMLRDPSGEMKGMIHRMVMKEYAAGLQTGSVLVLRQVGVFSPTVRNHYLNITPNNLVRLYTRDDTRTETVATTKIANFEKDDFKMPFPVPSPATRGPHPSPATRGPHPSPATRGPHPSPATRGPHPSPATRGPHPSPATRGPHPSPATRGPHPSPATRGPHPSPATRGPHPSPATRGPHPSPATRGPHPSPATRGPHPSPATRGPHPSPATRGPHPSPATRGPHPSPATRGPHPSPATRGPHPSPATRGPHPSPGFTSPSSTTMTLNNRQSGGLHPRTTGFVPKPPMSHANANVQYRRSADKSDSVPELRHSNIANINHGNSLFNLQSSHSLTSCATSNAVSSVTRQNMNIPHPAGSVPCPVVKANHASSSSTSRSIQPQHGIENLWQDDELDELLDDIGDELLTDF